MISMYKMLQKKILLGQVMNSIYSYRQVDLTGKVSITMLRESLVLAISQAFDCPRSSVKCKIRMINEAKYDIFFKTSRKEYHLQVDLMNNNYDMNEV